MPEPGPPHRRPGPRRAGRAGRSGRRRQPAAYLFVAPGLLLVALFLCYPVFENTRIAFYDWNTLGQPEGFAGLANFRHVLTDPYFWNAFRHTALFAGVTVPAGMAIALLFAIWLNNRRLPGRHLLRTIIFVPVVTSTAILGIVVSLMFNPLTGPVSAGLQRVGIAGQPVDWLGNPRTALWVVIAVAIWHGLGIGVVIFSAGLQSIPTELYEAADLDGASGVRRHWHITVPLLQPVLAIVALVSLLGAVAVFDLVLTLTGGGPAFASDVVGTYVYRNAFGQGIGATTRIGYASAAGLVMSTIILVGTAAYLGLRRLAARPGRGS